MYENVVSNNFSLQVDHGNTPYLVEAAKWAKFLSIIGFIICGLLLLTGVFFSSLFSTLSQLDSELSALGTGGTVFIAAWFIICAVIYFFPSYYLFSFASKMQTAIRNNDQVSLNDSFKNLKSSFKFWGILLIIMLCLYALVFIFTLLGSAFLG